MRQHPSADGAWPVNRRNASTAWKTAIPPPFKHHAAFAPALSAMRSPAENRQYPPPNGTAEAVGLDRLSRVFHAVPNGVALITHRRWHILQAARLTPVPNQTERRGTLTRGSAWRRRYPPTSAAPHPVPGSHAPQRCPLRRRQTARREPVAASGNPRRKAAAKPDASCCARSAYRHAMHTILTAPMALASSGQVVQQRGTVCLRDA